jgi:hypothetical protein
MSPSPIPNRITIDFRDAVRPSRSWILGVDDDAPERVELIAFGASPDGASGDPARRTRSTRSASARRPGARRRPTALMAECACPDFCERDHENE